MILFCPTRIPYLPMGQLTQVLLYSYVPAEHGPRNEVVTSALPSLSSDHPWTKVDFSACRNNFQRATVPAVTKCITTNHGVCTGFAQTKCFGLASFPRNQDIACWIFNLSIDVRWDNLPPSQIAVTGTSQASTVPPRETTKKVAKRRRKIIRRVMLICPIDNTCAVRSLVTVLDRTFPAYCLQ